MVQAFSESLPVYSLDGLRIGATYKLEQEYALGDAREFVVESNVVEVRQPNRGEKYVLIRDYGTRFAELVPISAIGFQPDGFRMQEGVRLTEWV